MEKNIKKIIWVIKTKDKLNWGEKWTESWLTYLNEMEKEIHEVRQELIKENNTVYLEDELCDIIWDYLNLVHNLHKQYPEISLKKILKRTYKKFDFRINSCWKWMLWADVKKIQKETLKKRHEKKYGKK